MSIDPDSDFAFRPGDISVREMAPIDFGWLRDFFDEAAADPLQGWQGLPGSLDRVFLPDSAGALRSSLDVMSALAGPAQEGTGADLPWGDWRGVDSPLDRVDDWLKVGNWDSQWPSTPSGWIESGDGDPVGLWLGHALNGGSGPDPEDPFAASSLPSWSELLV